MGLSDLASVVARPPYRGEPTQGQPAYMFRPPAPTVSFVTTACQPTSPLPVSPTTSCVLCCKIKPTQQVLPTRAVPFLRLPKRKASEFDEAEDSESGHPDPPNILRAIAKRFVVSRSTPDAFHERFDTGLTCCIGDSLARKESATRPSGKENARGWSKRRRVGSSPEDELGGTIFFEIRKDNSACTIDINEARWQQALLEYIENDDKENTQPGDGVVQTSDYMAYSGWGRCRTTKKTWATTPRSPLVDITPADRQRERDCGATGRRYHPSAWLAKTSCRRCRHGAPLVCACWYRRTLAATQHRPLASNFVADGQRKRDCGATVQGRRNTSHEDTTRTATAGVDGQEEPRGANDAIISAQARLIVSNGRLALTLKAKGPRSYNLDVTSSTYTPHLAMKWKSRHHPRALAEGLRATAKHIYPHRTLSRLADCLRRLARCLAAKPEDDDSQISSIRRAVRPQWKIGREAAPPAQRYLRRGSTTGA
ncbi:hypothetical protein BKA67DRAFT_692666 [Truncatella angustata]|uniref:Uncharacterized protein n=1 Tax=Truncatella angustata TaxID=152316 RepID=A0A9P8ZY07_9PEZI|nr:uncharacterized protein BKA67DRAFT_692666 [Truncatella angustata]KAH6653539.1 hypothetical protein BKA67DRAFT_692666 [Truncatella angustata]